MALFTNFFRFLIGFLLFPLFCFAQETVVSGKVTDAGSGDPIPFVNVVFKGTGSGATTDFDGNYSIRSIKPSDSITISYIGYKTKVRAIKRSKTQVVNIQLEEEVTHLQEVVVKAGENPAWPILRGVVDNKNKNDKRNLDAYEYDVYTKTEVDIDKISDKLRNKKVMKRIAQVLDSVDRVVGEDGKPILPLFITESVSKFYYRSNPAIRSETILKTKINGVGLDDGSMVTQLVGSTFQEYNFYLNWITIINKNFVSPIADGWRLYYDYDLIDSLMVGDDFCYRLDFYPKNPLELAFTGSMWITKKDFALKQIDASIGKESNVNFIDKIRIQQELGITQTGHWLPMKNRVLVDIGELGKNSAGLLAKFYTSNKNFVVNQPHKALFYDKPISIAEDAQIKETDQYWDSLRHEPLSAAEKSVYQMIDTIKNIPIVKTYTEVFKAVVDGYYDLGQIEIGPYVRTIAYNTVEGIRVQGGFKTNASFSKKITYSGYAAYGFQDTRVKGGGSAQFILSRNHWTTLTFRARRDIIRLGVDEDALAGNPLFLAAARWGQFKRAYYFDEGYISFYREFLRGLSGRASFRVYNFDPTYPFGFYRVESGDPPVYRELTTAEVSAEIRWARDETFLQNGNERLSLGLKKWPALTARYTHGQKGIMGSDYNYDKFRFSIDKRIRMGFLGVGLMSASYEYIWGKLPYPLLNVHLGNQSPIYSPFTYNLMNFGEFVSDESVTIRYRQFFEGLLVNRIPLLNKLKWRLVGTGNIIYGGLSRPNQFRIAVFTPRGDRALETRSLQTGKAYVEVGYGVENIFKFFRVDFIHRLSYLDPIQNPDARKFGVLFTAQFKL
ncbi:MAG: carboxypeptidase-like regulatory domain-containing protein [Cyclobacteriaceae bacterium]|nr:carboxypeptidase-like regulatory domain-containing protein [Cyclobacteriaceae bacterium]